MGSHPINLAVRFLLEMSALVSLGIWGWNYSDGWLQYILAIELGIFGFASWSLYDMGLNTLSIAFGTIVMIHYIISYDRIKWLMAR